MSLQDVFERISQMSDHELEKGISIKIFGSTKMDMAVQEKKRRRFQKNIELTNKLLDASRENAEASRQTSNSTKSLVCATWGLVMVTGILAVIPFAIPFLKTPN